MKLREYWPFLALLAIIAYELGHRDPEPPAPDWTDLELECAAFVLASPNGDRYPMKQILRYCRIYIQENAEAFGGADPI